VVLVHVSKICLFLESFLNSFFNSFVFLLLSVALQLAKRVYGFKYVVATASRPESIEFCKKMGADFTIDHNASDLQAELNKLPAET